VKRSLKFSLQMANTGKIKALEDLWIAYSSAINDFLKRLFAKQSLNEDYIKSYQNYLSPLSYRYKQCAKRQAFKIFKSWCRNKKKGQHPKLNSPSMTLDYRFIELQKSEDSSFDYWVKIATLDKGKPILIPIKSYDYANEYFRTWKLIKGGKIIKKNNKWILVLTFEKDTPDKKESGKIIGIDIGIKKLIVDSEGNQYGKDIEKLMDKIQRKQQDSKAFKRALKERDYYINRVVKALPYKEIKVIAMENIKNIKKNTRKEKKLNKQFRSKFQRWTYSKLIGRIKQLAEINGVHCQLIAPAYSSQTCNKCGFVHKLNRNGEVFSCRNCGYTADADYNASENILKSYLAQQAMVAGNVQGNICL
jgi:putative transposase